MAASVLMVAAFFPSLVWLLRTWLGSPYYGHGLLVPPVSAVLIWRAERSGREPTQDAAYARSSALGLLPVAMGIIAHVVSLPYHLYSASLVGLVLVIGGLVWLWEGSVALWRLAFPLAFLLLAIPIPGLEALTPPLARRVARAAAWGARSMGIPVLLDGAQVTLADTALTIGAPCSGLSSLIALTTLAALYAYLVHGPVLSRLWLVVLAAPVALAANLARVLFLLIVAHVGITEGAAELAHDWSSPVLYLFALLLLVGTGRTLGCVGLRSDI
jgi:exosortase